MMESAYLNIILKFDELRYSHKARQYISIHDIFWLDLPDLIDNPTEFCCAVPLVLHFVEQINNTTFQTHLLELPKRDAINHVLSGCPSSPISVFRLFFGRKHIGLLLHLQFRLPGAGAFSLFVMLFSLGVLGTGLLLLVDFNRRNDFGVIHICQDGLCLLYCISKLLVLEMRVLIVTFLEELQLASGDFGTA